MYCFIERREEFHQDEEYADHHGIRDDDGQLLNGLAAGANRLTREMSRHRRISSAGPEAKADARKRGAKMAVSQSGRPGSPLYRKAVTVWMLTAQGMDRMMMGFIQCGGATPSRSRAASPAR